jgi:hypothetical protein
MTTLKLISIVTILAFVGIITLQSCEKEDNEHGCGATNISAKNQDESHNMGQNCMNCHKDGGEGKGCFYIAGTVYDSLQTSTKPNGTVKLYSGPNGSGTLKGTIEVDAKGNFFTTNIVDLSSPVYPSVTNSNGDTKYMGSSTSTGQCNSCHGVSTNKIWVN